MRRIGQVLQVTACNYRRWKGNSRIVMVFLLAFILCFLLTDKVMVYAVKHGTTLCALEPFIWTFGDSRSILVASILLIFLFVDMPFLSSDTPFFLARTSRRRWVAGQILYIISATSLYLCFLLLSSVFLCMKNAFLANIWSATAAILGYSGEGEVLAVPSQARVMELSRPYTCARVIIFLMLLYTLVLTLGMMFFHLWKGGRAGILWALGFSCYGCFLDPATLEKIFSLPEELAYKSRVWVGWLSPLNHATYGMHDFGYDHLPKLKDTYVILACILLAFILGTMKAIRGYGFEFRGTREGEIQ